MLNMGKIRLMTDIAIYEKKHSDSVFKVNNYYRGDYIAGNMAAAFVRFTLCSVLVLIFVVLFGTDVFFEQINEEGISAVFTQIGLLYGAGLLLYLLIAYNVYSRRYKNAKRGVLLYATKLKRLQRKYCCETQAPKTGKRKLSAGRRAAEER
ncbi:MAG: hypothetical protein Q4C63_01590 [Eubacteriales bacterium]|nr:hypothetical protein [Eubacteriales bacterium]